MVGTEIDIDQMNEKTPYSGSENLEIMKEAVNYNRFLRYLVAKHATNRSKILDFGAGIGTFSDSVPIPIDRISCVEPDQVARTTLAERGYTVFESAGQLTRSTYSYVFSLNVLEHIEDHEAVVAQLYEAIEPGGKITIATDLKPINGEQHVIIIFEDTGTGIVNENLNNIFLPFYSTKKGNVNNLGLGLSISHSIITKNQGTISVQNMETVGCQFEISFPQSNL